MLQRRNDIMLEHVSITIISKHRRFEDSLFFNVDVLYHFKKINWKGRYNEIINV